LSTQKILDSLKDVMEKPNYKDAMRTGVGKSKGEKTR
jgi:hypothetical protein